MLNPWLLLVRAGELRCCRRDFNRQLYLRLPWEKELRDEG